MTNLTKDRDVFIEEYTRESAIAKYLSETAGDGIGHLLMHVYGSIYSRVIEALTRTLSAAPTSSLGVWRGTNLLKLVELLPARCRVGERMWHGLLTAHDRSRT